MKTGNNELYKFENDPQYRKKIMAKIHKEQDNLYNQRIKKIESELKKLSDQRNQEILRIQKSRWEKIVDEKVMINRTEGKIRINQTETYFSSINGANINLQTSARAVTEEISNVKSKKHASLGGAVVGGLAAGPVGAVAGGVGLGKTKTTGKAKTITNQIPTCIHLGVVVNLDNFPTEIVFISKEVDQSSSVFLSAQNKAQNLISQLGTISKIPVPQHFLRADEEASVKKYDDLIQQKQYEHQKAIEDIPQYEIPTIYRSEEHCDKTDEEYLTYLRDNDSIRQLQISQKQNNGNDLYKSSGLAIASFILGIVGMFLSCIFLGIFPAIVGLILGIIALCKINSRKTFAIIGVVLSSIGIVIFSLILILVNIDHNDSESENIVENTVEMPTEAETTELETETTQTETEKDNLDEQPIYESVNQSTDEYTESSEIMLENTDLLTEEEYKAMCQELWHNDIFFSEEDLTGKYVKLDLFVKESRIYDVTSWQVDDVKEFADLYDIKRDFFFCGVNHEGEIAAYMGGNLRLYFTNEYDLDPNDIKPGDHLVVWGKIVRYGQDSYSGYNICYLIPKYIDKHD